jgi:GT2 family glycosyltransferase
LFDEIGGFRTALGHVGNVPSGGDDVDLVRRLRSRGVEIFYEPKAVVYHHIPKIRQRRKWLLRRCYYGGMSTPILDNLKLVRIKDIFYNFRLALLFLLKSFLSLVGRQAVAVVENACQSAIYMGRIVGLIKMYFKE